jgi:hypothetical protein
VQRSVLGHAGLLRGACEWADMWVGVSASALGCAARVCLADEQATARGGIMSEQPGDVDQVDCGGPFIQAPVPPSMYQMQAGFRVQLEGVQYFLTCLLAVTVPEGKAGRVCNNGYGNICASAYFRGSGLRPQALRPTAPAPSERGTPKPM